ncbi:hypothetical protein PV08_07915 [Exophiala spinifera]|uniref:Uncharacterized protein n=1 Tax=Exophiala spinifera TaxID=91928 RepID=A0A0D2B894_9EURO|nr:uncharacterized protein PV08_07915 [Exophiala spinifera]KIW15128.1 hypothetical protein PV08_07915 [Exophiala spinifera]
MAKGLSRALLLSIIGSKALWQAPFETKQPSLNPERNGELTNDIADAYGMSSNPPVEKYLKGLIARATDGAFRSLPYIFAEASSKNSTPVSVYRFKQVDTFDVSPQKGHACHAIDNSFFCRFHAVAGPNADPDVRVTADRLSQSILDLAYGTQP